MKSLIIALALLINALSAVELVDDDVYFYHSDKMLEIYNSTNDNVKPYIFHHVASALFDARRYQDALSISIALSERLPIPEYLYANISVYAGKCKQYESALEYADRAIVFQPNAIHPKLVKASWLHHLGRAAEAEKLVKSVTNDGTSIYYSCVACYAADSGNVELLKDAVSGYLKTNDDRTFFERDIVFDQYREQDWFVSLFGKTLLVSN